MIRPEARDAILRWREALAGGALLAAGAWLLATGYGLPLLLGGAASALGAVLVWSGLRHGRLRGEDDAPGLVEVDEGRITYLAPVMGGTVSLDELAEVSLRRMAAGEAFWRLAPVDGGALMVPTGARGADALLDALSPLPGFDGGAMVRAAREVGRGAGRGTVIVWRRHPRPALTRA